MGKGSSSICKTIGFEIQTGDIFTPLLAPGGYFRFQVTGRIEGFGRRGRGNLSRDFGGIQNSLMIRSYIIYCFLEIFMAQKFGMGFLGVKFWSRDFWGFLIFAPIWSSLSLEIWSTPLGPLPSSVCTNWLSLRSDGTQFLKTLLNIVRINKSAVS